MKTTRAEEKDMKREENRKKKKRREEKGQREHTENERRGDITKNAYDNNNKQKRVYI